MTNPSPKNAKQKQNSVCVWIGRFAQSMCFAFFLVGLMGIVHGLIEDNGD